jgi:hypothetical protein
MQATVLQSGAWNAVQLAETAPTFHTQHQNPNPANKHQNSHPHDYVALSVETAVVTPKIVVRYVRL